MVVAWLQWLYIRLSQVKLSWSTASTAPCHDLHLLVVLSLSQRTIVEPNFDLINFHSDQSHNAMIREENKILVFCCSFYLIHNITHFFEKRFLKDTLNDLLLSLDSVTFWTSVFSSPMSPSPLLLTSSFDSFPVLCWWALVCLNEGGLLPNGPLALCLLRLVNCCSFTSIYRQNSE